MSLVLGGSCFSSALPDISVNVVASRATSVCIDLGMNTREDGRPMSLAEEARMSLNVVCRILRDHNAPNGRIRPS
jgi:hypothetical protein